MTGSMDEARPWLVVTGYHVKVDVHICVQYCSSMKGHLHKERCRFHEDLPTTF